MTIVIIIPTPTKLPAGKIFFDLGVKENIISDLDFNTAQAELTIGEISVKSFIHAQNNYGLIEINKTGINLRIDNPKYGKIKRFSIKFPSKGTVQSLKNLHYPDAEFFNETESNINYQYFIQPTNDGFYGIVTAKYEYNHQTLIAYTVGFGKDKSFAENCKAIIKSAIEKGYANAYNEHKKWWAEY